MKIRRAEHNDLPQIVAIYNQAVSAGFQTADTEQWKLEEKQAWFEEHCSPVFPLFVVVEDGVVAGYAVISAYRPGRDALTSTKEVSCYIHHNYLRQGLGMQLLRHAINTAALYKAKTLIAIVLDVNLGSIALLQKAGFTLWGHLSGIANFNGITCGHVYYGLHLTQVE